MQVASFVYQQCILRPLQRARIFRLLFLQETRVHQGPNGIALAFRRNPHRYRIFCPSVQGMPRRVFGQ